MAWTPGGYVSHLRPAHDARALAHGKQHGGRGGVERNDACGGRPRRHDSVAIVIAYHAHCIRRPPALSARSRLTSEGRGREGGRDQFRRADGGATCNLGGMNGE